MNAVGQPLRPEAYSDRVRRLCRTARTAIDHVALGAALPSRLAPWERPLPQRSDSRGKLFMGAVCESAVRGDIEGPSLVIVNEGPSAL